MHGSSHIFAAAEREIPRHDADHFKGYTVHASKDEPRYQIKSGTTDQIAMHKGSALIPLRR
ncbi:MAG: DUF2945 domain-containing protein [Gemmatimonadales bacterium]